MAAPSIGASLVAAVLALALAAEAAAGPQLRVAALSADKRLATSVVQELGVDARGGRMNTTMNMNPDSVFKTLFSVQKQWLAEAETAFDHKIDQGEAVDHMSVGCSKIASAIVTASDGDRNRVKEYMGEVCGHADANDHGKALCEDFALVLQKRMSVNTLENRDAFSKKKFCEDVYDGEISNIARARHKARDAKLKEDQEKQERAAKEQVEAKRVADAAARSEAAITEAEKKKAEDEERKNRLKDPSGLLRPVQRLLKEHNEGKGGTVTSERALWAPRPTRLADRLETPIKASATSASPPPAPPASLAPPVVKGLITAVPVLADPENAAQAHPAGQSPGARAALQAAMAEEDRLDKAWSERVHVVTESRLGDAWSRRVHAGGAHA